MHRNASPMGQIYLGFRSLLFKIAVFVVMAALLAWALGGTLWPRVASRVIGPPAKVGGVSWVLVDQIGDLDSTFGIARLDDTGRAIEPFPNARSESPRWDEAMPPVAAPGGDQGAFAKCCEGTWAVVVFRDGETGHRGEDVVEVVVPNRWEAARRLERFARTGSTALAEATDQPSATDTEADATGDASSAG